MTKSIVNSNKTHIEQADLPGELRGVIHHRNPLVEVLPTEDLTKAAKLTPGRASHGNRGVFITLHGGSAETRLYTDYVQLTYEQWCLLLEALDIVVEDEEGRWGAAQWIDLLCMLDL